MQIENQNIQDENERLFTDYLARQPLINPKDFTFEIDAYRALYPEAAQQLIKNPLKYYVLIKKYLERQDKAEDLKKKFISKTQRYDIKIEGNLGANFVTPRGLNSRMANQLVGLQGIITKMDICQYYLEQSKHFCPKTNTHQTRDYPDSFNPEKQSNLGQGRSIKTKDDSGNPLEFQFGYSIFKDTQLVVIQELPQMAPPGLLPMSVQVVLQNNLVNLVKPGDRVQMIGIYKLISGLATKEKGIFRPYFICLSIKPLNMVLTSVKRNIKTDFPKHEIYDLFSRSVAPSVWGHECLKKAVLLMLVGGVQKVLENNTHLRGDINLLMIGDPGTAKSQMLRWILSTVDISIGTTGSGASGVGLTAAVVSDRQTGERSLEAGAMVLADRGVVCIDEFDKMNEVDRVAVHEVMQQQTVTIAKAGLHCSLNARCAVVAAANPIYGEYQTSMPPTKNIGMPDSLLSRFDLIFIIKDEKTKQRDQQISQKVCRNHRLAPQINDFINQYIDADDYVVNPIQDKKIDVQTIYEKNNVYKTEGKSQILTQHFFKRYINHVKQNVVPQLTDDSVTLCAALWSLLRDKDANDGGNKATKVLPVTIRTMQSLIRLSTAHAKLLMSQTVEVENVIEAFKLFCFCNHGAQDALMEDASNILKDHGIDYDIKMSFQKKSLRRENIYETKEERRENYHEPKPKEEVRKMQPESIKKKMSKMNLRQNERQADDVLQKHVEKPSYSKQQMTMTYKTLSDMHKKKRGNERCVSVNELLQETKKIKGGVNSIQTLNEILDVLEKDSKIIVEDGKIYMT